MSKIEKDLERVGFVAGMARGLVVAGKTPREARALVSAYAVAFAAVGEALGKVVGVVEGGMDWEYGTLENDTLDEAVEASPLFDGQSDALLTFASAVHAAAFVLAEDVEGAWAAAKAEQHGH